MNIGGVKVKMPPRGGSEIEAVVDCVTALWVEAEKDNAHVVVVLDEANAFLQTTNKGTDDTVKLFNTLVLHTKQTRHMSVVLLSSDEALPFRLGDLGLNAAHVREKLVVGGAAPQEMLRLLEELGAGKNLRELLVRVYGGDVWQLEVAVGRLVTAVETGGQAHVLREPLDYIEDAIALWVAQGGDKERLVYVLEEVARCGFCPLDKNDTLAHVLTKSNACTFLSNGAQEFFIAPEVRCNRSGVTASTPLVRVLIPVALERLKENRSDAKSGN